MSLPEVTEALRAAVRPVLAIGLPFAAIGLVAAGIPVPEWLVALGSGAVAWYFQERTEQHRRNGGV